MTSKETTLSKVKVGDLIWDSSDYPSRSYPRLVTRITASMVVSQDYRLAMRDDHMSDNPENLKTIGLKSLKTWGDHWNGGASFPIKDNEKLIGLGPEKKMKKYSKYRGQTSECMAFVVNGKDAEIKYDFYIR